MIENQENLEKTIPFIWENWDLQDVLLHTYYNVTFVEDFGKIEKGEKFDSLNVDYGKGIIEAYSWKDGDPNSDLEPIKTVLYKAIAI